MTLRLSRPRLVTCGRTVTRVLYKQPRATLVTTASLHATLTTKTNHWTIYVIDRTAISTIVVSTVPWCSTKTLTLTGSRYQRAIRSIYYTPLHSYECIIWIEEMMCSKQERRDLTSEHATTGHRSKIHRETSFSAIADWRFNLERFVHCRCFQITDSTRKPRPFPQSHMLSSRTFSQGKLSSLIYI